MELTGSSMHCAIVFLQSFKRIVTGPLDSFVAAFYGDEFSSKAQYAQKYHVTLYTWSLGQAALSPLDFQRKFSPHLS